jgi:hypothetical protein
MDKDELQSTEIILPGIKLKHMEKVIKFIYCGKLTITAQDLYQNYSGKSLA